MSKLEKVDLGFSDNAAEESGDEGGEDDEEQDNEYEKVRKDHV